MSRIDDPYARIFGGRTKSSPECFKPEVRTDADARSVWKREDDGNGSRPNTRRELRRRKSESASSPHAVLSHRIAGASGTNGDERNSSGPLKKIPARWEQERAPPECHTWCGGCEYPPCSIPQGDIQRALCYRQIVWSPSRSRSASRQHVGETQGQLPPEVGSRFSSRPDCHQSCRPESQMTSSCHYSKHRHSRETGPPA